MRPTPIPRRVLLMPALLTSQQVPDVPILTEGRHAHCRPHSRLSVPSHPKETARPAGSLNGHKPSFYPQGFTPYRSLSDPPLRTSRSHPTEATGVGRGSHPLGECTLPRRTLKMGQRNLLWGYRSRTLLELPGAMTGMMTGILKGIEPGMRTEPS